MAACSTIKVNWMDHFNSSWANEDMEALVSRLGVVSLYEKLLSNKEATSIPQSSLQMRGPQLQDFQRGASSTLDEHKQFLRDLLSYQLGLARAVSSDSPFHSTLRRRLVILQRILSALSTKFHTKSGELRRSTGTSGGKVKLKDVTKGTEVKEGATVLMEMGVKTGLSLLFALLRQSWQLSQGSLCNDVLLTACDVLSSLPPLSLSNDSKIPDLGQECLGKVTEFLRSAVSPNSSANVKGRRLSCEVLLRIAAMRGSLESILQWVVLVLTAAHSQQQKDSCGSLKELEGISVNCLRDVLSQMRDPAVSLKFCTYTVHITTNINNNNNNNNK